MEDKKKDVKLKSPLGDAFNNIVNINRSKTQMKSTQSTYTEFLRFMTTEVKVIQAIKLPEEKKIKKLANINVAATFGNAGSLLSSLASGALDAAGLVGDLFGGRKGKTPNASKPGQPSSPKAGKSIPKGKKIRLPGVRGLPLISAALAGLDFAQGISEGESTGKAGAGALGSAAGAAGGALAGTALAGVIGQTLVPIPGLGFVLGAAVGSLGGFAGGYLADRAYESATGEGNVKEKQKAKLKQQEQLQKAKAAAAKTTFPEVSDKFESVVVQFEKSISLGTFESSSDVHSEEISMEIMEDDANYGERDKSPSDLPGTIQELESSGGSLPSSKLGSKYGMRMHPILKVNKMHYGNDYPMNQGTPISVIQPGKVANAGFVNNGYGIQVKVDHPGGVSSFYAHLSSANVSAGQDISPGTVIGKVGSTGRSTGPHLHFEVDANGKVTDPTPYQDKIFRFGGDVKVKATAKPQQNMAGQPVPPQQQTQEEKPKPSTTAPPPSADMAAKFEQAWQYRNNPLARGRIESAWEGMSPDQQQQAKEWAKTKGYDWNEMKLKEKQVSQQVSATVVPVPSMQQNVPQQIEQYPDYNLPQSSVTLMPIYIGGGAQPQQRPIVVAGGGGGGGATIMPPVSEGHVLNSLFKTILLTNLSGT
jgi:murein DD-endopeptidase MepM/ murein hydrolase activator NlpD